MRWGKPVVEKWKLHPKYQDYEISDMGRVRRATRKKGAVVGKVLKPGISWQGYRAVKIDGKCRRVYVLVLETFVGPRPSGHEVRHLNDIKDDDRLANLRWGTHAENYADRRRSGGGNHGSRHGMSKLTESDIPAIRMMRQRGMTQTAIGHRFGVSRGCIRFVIQGRRWAHVQ